jgi:hypothetical protein
MRMTVENLEQEPFRKSLFARAFSQEPFRKSLCSRAGAQPLDLDLSPLPALRAFSLRGEKPGSADFPPGRDFPNSGIFRSNSQGQMSEEGHQAAYLLAQAKSGLTPISDIARRARHVGQVPKGDKLL